MKTNIALRFFAAAAVFLCFCSTTLQADSVTDIINIEDFDDQEYEFEFTTTTDVLSFDSIEITMSHDNVEQVQIFMEETGPGSPYAFFTLVNGFGSGTGNRIGVADGDLTDLDGMATLTFVPSGAATTVRGFAADPVPTGNYLAEDWENHFGTGSPPYTPTTFRVVVRDSSVAFSEMGALGSITVNFTTAVPEPTSAGLLSLGVLGFLARRRRN